MYKVSALCVSAYTCVSIVFVYCVVCVTTRTRVLTCEQASEGWSHTTPYDCSARIQTRPSLADGKGHHPCMHACANKTNKQTNKPTDSPPKQKLFFLICVLCCFEGQRIGMFRNPIHMLYSRKGKVNTDRTWACEDQQTNKQTNKQQYQY